MIYLEKHRLITELEKKIAKGQTIHFLTGDGLNDHFFYDLYYGCRSLDETLRIHYLQLTQNFDYMIYVVGSKGKLSCWRQENGNVEEVDKFQDLLAPTVRKGVLNKKNHQSDTENTQVKGESKEAADEIREQMDSMTVVIEELTKLLKRGSKRVILLLEGLEWIADFYGNQVDNTWIAALKRWEKMQTLMAVVTISDMELIKKYQFAQPSTYVGNPSADEIKYAYLRYLLRHVNPSYNLDMNELEKITQGLSVGKKTLVAALRILRKVLEKYPSALKYEDFEGTFEENILEKVTWESVRLEEAKKKEIAEAVDSFLAGKGRKGILLTGPPGTGKTMLAKALATEKQCYFLAPKLADLKGEYVGQTSGKVKRIFAEARGNEPTILFIDEADTVFPSRSLGAGDRDSFGLDMVNQFLQEMDGATTGTQRIFTIAATNRPTAVDSAIKSRLSGNPITIPLPSKAMRKLIFEDCLTVKNRFFTLGKLYEEYVLEKSEGMI